MMAAALIARSDRRRAPREAPCEILGVTVAAPGWDEAIGLLARRISERRFTKVGFLNAHIANIASGNAAFARIMRDFLVLPDGVGVDVAARMLYGRPFPANLNGTDFVPAFLAAQERPLTIGLVGASRRNVEGAARTLEAMLPQHRIVVVSDGFFDAEQERDVLATLEEIHPDVLLVAMGVPRQEMWIAERLGPAHCTMVFAVGALLDFLSGAVPRAPEWLRRMRLEWLFRLIIEPARLWRRYLVGNPLFIARVLRQKVAGMLAGE